MFKYKATKLGPRSQRQFHPMLGFWSIALSGMLVLLATVAVLQYRWTNQASNANEMRIGAELDSLMMKWHGDLYSEFSAICTAIQVGPDSGARDTWNDYLDRYVQWSFALPHESLPYIYKNPDLVENIYIWETTARPNPRLFRLDVDSRKIEPLAAPAKLFPLLARLQANSASLTMALGAWKLPGQSPAPTTGADIAVAATPSGSDSTTGWQFDEKLPAIVHPLLHHREGGSLSSRNPVDWIIITVDTEVLRKRVLPELSTRYFGGLDGLEYNVAVVRSGSNPGDIYSSDGGFGFQHLAAADATMQIFGIPPDLPTNSNGNPTPNGSSLRGTGWRQITAPIWFPVIQYGQDSYTWLLELQHRAGPLQMAIDKVRRNNLAISFLVLLLLAGSVVVLTVAGYRFHNFAKLQMDFVASISHELRTPLTAIFSAGENIKDGVIRNYTDLAEYGSIVTAQSRQLMNHVDRILLFASIRSGKDRYTLRPLKITDVLDTVRRNLSAWIAEEESVLEETIEPDLPLVMGDMFGVCGCLENLITNAIKYGGPDHRICLSARLRTLAEGHQEVAVSVEDRGMGIAPSELKRIFEPFYRTHEATAAQIHGTGLGLSLAKHLAEAMGGRLTVVSQVGSGSIFTLHLQLAPGHHYELSTEHSHAASR
jgi:signal transduction histidine kinase